MINVVDFTIWNTDSREVHSTGCAVEGTVVPPEGHAVHYGERVPETHIFGPDDLPVPRETPRPISPDEARVLINRERQRRIEAGRDFGGVRVTGSDKDISNLTNLALGAQMRMLSGDTTTVTTFRDGNNVDHDLTPMDIIGLWQAASAHVTAIYAASWAIKAMDPVPTGYADDAYWP